MTKDDVSTDGLVDLALDAWEATAGTRRDMMRNALNAALAALQRSNAKKDEALRKVRSLIPKHIAAWGSEQEIADICDEALSHSSETKDESKEP